jgi:hypothetical protein
MVGMTSKRFLLFSSGLLFLAAILPGANSAQQVIKNNLAPATVSPAPYILSDAVVTQQWPVTLPLVNAPETLTHLSPGQCIRVGVIASGKGHRELIRKVSIGFTAKYGAQEQSFPTQDPQGTKQMKPEGSDFVTSALAAGGIVAPDMSMASMAGSAGKWCVPGNAQSGNVEIAATVTVAGRVNKLRPTVVEVDSLVSLSAPFKSAEEASQWMQRYHFAPRPALLVPAAQILLPHKNGLPFLQEFLVSALRQNPETASRLGPELTASDRVSMLFLLDLFNKANAHLDQPPVLNDDDKQILAQAPALPNPFEMTPNRELFSKLDRLWGNFAATGSIEPIKVLSSALAWRTDYDAFVEMKKEGRTPTELTDSLVRALTYMSAGWSLGSFKRSDGLAADYIEAISASPDTPASIKKELAKLDTEPAFNRNNEK